MAGYELYGLLETYFKELAREILTNAPRSSPFSTTSMTTNSNAMELTSPDSPLHATEGSEQDFVTYYVRSYLRYSSGATQINRLFAYLNRHFVMRAIDEGCGWICLQDVIASSVLKGGDCGCHPYSSNVRIHDLDLASISISTSARTPKQTTPARKEKGVLGSQHTNHTALVPSSKKTKENMKKLLAKKRVEWRKWGYDADNGDTDEARKIAELCAQAASTTDRIVTIGALAMRCWRLEVAEPLLNAASWNASKPSPQMTDATFPISPKINSAVHPTSSMNYHPTNPEGQISISHNHFPSSVPDANSLKGKGKGKGKSETAYCEATPITTRLSTAISGDDPGKQIQQKSMRISQEKVEIKIHSGATKASTTVSKKRTINSRKGPLGATTSFAAVRAAVAQRQSAESGGLDLSLKSPLSRAVTLLLQGPDVLSERGYGTDQSCSDTVLSLEQPATPTKISQAMIIAESLKICGVSPDDSVRRRIDRYLLKVGRGEGQTGLGRSSKRVLIK